MDFFSVVLCCAFAIFVLKKTKKKTTKHLYLFWKVILIEIFERKR